MTNVLQSFSPRLYSVAISTILTAVRDVYNTAGPLLSSSYHYFIFELTAAALVGVHEKITSKRISAETRTLRHHRLLQRSTAASRAFRTIIIIIKINNDKRNKLLYLWQESYYLTWRKTTTATSCFIDKCEPRPPEGYLCCVNRTTMAMLTPPYYCRCGLSISEQATENNNNNYNNKKGK